METNPKKLLSALALIIVFISFFLWREVRNYRSISTEMISEPLIADSATALPITSDDQILGNPGAPLTIVEYIDLNSPESKNLNYTITKFVNENPLKARVIFKHYTKSSIFSKNDLPNRAAWCAGRQKKLWEYVSLIDKEKKSIKPEALSAIAREAKLNFNMWKACFDSEQSTTAIAAETLEAKKLGLGDPPLIFVNNKKLNTDLEFNLSEFFISLIAN